MCPPSIALWCFALLLFRPLVVSFSESQENSTNGNEQSDNSTVLYDSLISSMEYRNDKREMEPTRCNSRESSIKNDDEMQYESCINSTKNDRKNHDSDESRGHIVKNHEENNQMSMEFHALTLQNSTKTNDSILQEINENLSKTEGESNSTLFHKLYKNYNINYNNNSIVSYEACDNVTCIQLCCPFGNRLTMKGQCVAEWDNYSFPAMHGNDFKDKKFDKLFLTVRDPCIVQGFGRRLLNANEYLFLVNGSLSHLNPKTLILPTSYCLAILNQNIYDVIVCTSQTKLPVYISACLLVSLPFLLLTFVVYSILPELQNMHGYTLRAHVASLFITYAIMYVGQQNSGLATKSYCIPLAYIFNFFFLASFFWLNITCFDIWWTFRGIRSCRTSIKQEKKKFVIYSIYVWGITFILNVICAIIDNVPGISKNLIRPEICKRRFWFGEDEAKTLYFYIPMGITIISNICFFIVTTLTIFYQNIHTAQQMRNSESMRHNENKQRFKMYLKLFIVMGISWVMEIMAWWINADFVPVIVWYPTNIINALQGLIIFIIFVCTKKIKQLLLKRFSGQNCGFCKIPTNNDSITSNTTSISGLSASGTVPMQEIDPSNQQL